MAVVVSWQDKSRAYLNQALNDWATACSLTPDVREGIAEGGVAGTLAAPILYLANSGDTPRYNDEGYMQCGHIVSYKLKTASRGDAQEDTGDIAESIINYVMDCVVRNTPTSGTVLTANTLTGGPPWLLVDIDTDIVTDETVETGFDWYVAITFVFTLAVTNRRLHS
jgi:hypothetical protein